MRLEDSKKMEKSLAKQIFVTKFLDTIFLRNSFLLLKIIVCKTYAKNCSSKSEMPSQLLGYRVSLASVSETGSQRVADAVVKVPN